MRGGYDDTERDRRERDEAESNRLLRAHRALNKDGVYSESALARRTAAEILAGDLKVWSEDSMLFADRPDEETRVTFDELLSAVNITARQRRYYRLIKRLGRYDLVAAECGVGDKAVRRTLARLFLRVHAAYPAVAESMPTDWARRLFNDELRCKFALVYHKPPAQKISAYRHERSRQELAIKKAAKCCRDGKGRFARPPRN
jgi:hypothetical protein